MDVAAAGNAMVFSATERLREVDEEAVAQFTKEEKQARRKEQNRLAQQDLRRRRATHTRDLETKVEELIGKLDEKDREIRMLYDILEQLQRDSNSVPRTSEALKIDIFRG